MDDYILTRAGRVAGSSAPGLVRAGDSRLTPVARARLGLTFPAAAGAKPPWAADRSAEPFPGRMRVRFFSDSPWECYAETDLTEDDVVLLPPGRSVLADELEQDARGAGGTVPPGRDGAVPRVAPRTAGPQRRA
jgi:hypothetical protein